VDVWSAISPALRAKDHTLGGLLSGLRSRHVWRRVEAWNGQVDGYDNDCRLLARLLNNGLLDPEALQQLPKLREEGPGIYVRLAWLTGGRRSPSRRLSRHPRRLRHAGRPGRPFENRRGLPFGLRKATHIARLSLTATLRKNINPRIVLQEAGKLPVRRRRHPAFPPFRF